MNKQLIDMIDAVAYEKSMPKDLVRTAMEQAVAALARREEKSPLGAFEAKIDSDGQVTVWRRFDLVERAELEDPERQIAQDDDMCREDGANVDGGVLKISVPTPAWTRQGLQVVKQVLAQKLKQGLRQTIAEAWGGRVGEVVLGQVKRIDRDRVVIDLGEPVEGVISGRDKIPGENLKVGHRVRALITKVDAEGNGPTISLSRTADDFVKELIAIEVPEVEIGQVKIRSVARDPGGRAKVAVEAGPGLRNHPAAVCVGMRGVRAQAVSGELNGERLEFVEWNEDPAQFLINALEPAEIKTLVLDADENRAMVGVEASNLARAIGTRGQNVRLASRLTGWAIDLMTVEDLEAKRQAEDIAARNDLMSLMDIDEELATILVDEGFMTVEDIALAPDTDLLAIEGMGEDIVEALQARAHDAVALKQMLDQSQAHEFDVLDGINREDIDQLMTNGVSTLNDLAEQSVYDLESWPEDDHERLSHWIMQARQITGMI